MNNKYLRHLSNIWLLLLIWPTRITAQPSSLIQIEQPDLPGPFQNFGTAIARIYDIIIVVAGVAFVILLLVGGIMYMTAAGDAEGTKKARGLMLDAVIGLVIVVMAWTVSRWVICTLLQIPGVISC